MVNDLLSGRVTSFRREQGFGVITLDDGRDVKFDASACTMVPEEGTAVRLRIAPARWGGGFKAVHVEECGSALFVPAPAPASLDMQIAALQREHLVAALSEHVMSRLVTDAFGGRLAEVGLIDVLDAFYTADAASARSDGYLGFAREVTVADAHAAVTAAIPGIAVSLPPGAAALEDVVAAANQALAVAGDPRKLHRLRSRPDRCAYFVLSAERAQQLARLLPFAT
jgi:cold shock CspA family protein